ncbi:nuclear transport factor 2 family protein [Chloroflexota bacterium]
MKLEELEAKYIELEENYKRLQSSVRVLQDVEEIKRLQRMYGYYIEHWQRDEIIALFSNDPDTTVEIGAGYFHGKESIERLFGRFGKQAPPEFLHMLSQICPVVDVDPDGKTASGRWYGFGCLSVDLQGKTSPILNTGIYENEYVKEDGKWKFKTLRFYLTFFSPFEDGWVKSPIPPGWPANSELKPDRESSTRKPYPSGFIVPYHYKHPITGK